MLSPLPTGLGAAALLVAIGILAAACAKPLSDGVAPAGSSAPAAPGAPSATAGPVVAIPAGKLLAGTACGAHPRVPAEELAGDVTPMRAFDIDAYPYPNDQEKAPLTGVPGDEAGKLCEARGRRLCTELEQERSVSG